ncbi:MAG: glycerol kinase GlpK [Blautia sp.]|nr:glycerol kinase GlpK [Blautia sp.]
MTEKYILAVDQSTQGTKGLLFDSEGRLFCRADRPHRQIISEKGWVSHNLTEILENTLDVCADVIKSAGIKKDQIAAFGISNQRETTAAWNISTGLPVCDAIVWQCGRAAEVCRKHEDEAESIRQKTGITLSPFFPASKMQWIMENVPEAKEAAANSELAFGTIDSWLVWNLTNEHAFKTDYSNASRTQLFNICDLKWDEEICRSFGIPAECLAEVCMSDSIFGYTDLGGLLPHTIPICGVLGDSHGALFGQDCRQPGLIKATYGTGSSVMMNIGKEMLISDRGIVTSLAWGRKGQVEYVFEGNLNYTGAVITWLKNDLQMIKSAADTGSLAEEANPEDGTYFIPAFTGLGAPYWKPDATGMFTGITRTTGRKEMVKACVECIAYQITDLVELMREESGLAIDELRADGGPTGNSYLMQFQSDMARVSVRIPEIQELSGMGAAYMAGITAGLYDEEEVFTKIQHSSYSCGMPEEIRKEKYAGWKKAVERAISD